MTEHIKVLGILHIVWSLWSLMMTGLSLAVTLFVVGAVAATEDDGNILLISALIMTVVGGFLMITLIPGLVGGIALLEGRSWARVVLMIAAVVNALNFPFGTVLAVYTFIVVLDDDVRRELAA